MKRVLCLLFLLVGVGVYGLDVRDADQQPNYKVTVAKWMKDFREQPRFKGEFAVGVVFVNFPDTVPIDGEAWMAEHAEEATEYFKAYTQGKCWPKFVPYGQEYRSNYTAESVRGYYTFWDSPGCLMGYRCLGDGKERYKELEKTVDAHLRRTGRGLKPEVTVYVYGSKLRPKEELGEIKQLREDYPEKLETEYYTYGDRIGGYRPIVGWGDPLWPHADGRKVVLQAASSTETLIHELGHVLGAPDSYHVAQKYGGVPGTPVTLPGGPTGPLFWRWKYCGLLPQAAFPLITSDSEITLAPRTSTYQKGGAPLGVFIPTAHPYYMLHLEYEPEAVKPYRGTESCAPLSLDALDVDGGVHIYYVNICQPGSYFGHPDLVYNYRTKDKWMQGGAITVAPFAEGDAFDAESDPANVLPNQLPTGVELTFGEQTLEGAKVTIRVPKQQIKGKELKQSRLPIVDLTEVNDVRPGSFIATMFVRFRGEPLYSERGIVYGPAPHPTIKRNKVWKMEGIGYDATRVTGVAPGSKIYVRAYAKNALGVTYSEQEEVLTIPREATESEPLIISRATWSPFVQLMNFYRVPIVTTKVLSPTTAPDYQRIHPDSYCPLQHHAPTVSHHQYAARLESECLRYLGISGKDFPEDFEERLTKLFNLKTSRKSIKHSPVILLPKDTPIAPHLEQIKAELVAGRPVVLFRELRRISSNEHIDIVLLDGYREDDDGPELHVSFENGYDSGAKPTRRSGWHAPEVLSDTIEDACLLFFNPLKK